VHDFIANQLQLMNVQETQKPFGENK